MNKLFLSGIFLAYCSGLHAQNLTSSSEYGLPIIQNVTEIDETGYLALFDSDLGVLTAITLNLHGAGTTDITLTNSAATPISARITATSSLFFSSGLAPLDTFLQNNAAQVSLDFPLGLQDFEVGETRNFGQLTSSKSKSFDLSSLIPHMQASGGGTFSLNAQSLNGLTILGGGGNLSSQQSTIAGAGASIVYTYAIPEPSSALLATLAASFCLFGRRRR